ncbi:CpaF/VirB11 family protein [Helicobacter cetorum]|uniref:VirB11 protein n=1 Tax=Helicobacter cetorum (strain ATCC BAA-540 / CCUG 52418 / MIT 99-5656) TaxID=1163745 RepID=I0EQF3_HELCM|nr:type II/IV secretion system ATPase subunit [Helicobacter cetorum]AFI05172.1 virB11 protein [Helicobacter cetorum MIT 99-5656]
MQTLQTHRVLQALIAHFTPFLESGITELIINNEQELWLYKVNNTREKIKAELFSKEFLLRFCEQLASFRGLFFDEFHPTLNCSIPFTRYRVSANHFSITTNNQITLNIRVPQLKPLNLDDFTFKTSDKESLKDLALKGHNILISGETSSGKTSLLNALLNGVDKNERIVSVEDSQELDLKAFENSIGLLVGKQENGCFNYEDALNMAMRLNPDRLIVGEIDTRNAALFLRLGNTGHKGMLSTIHASSAKKTLEALSLNLGMRYSHSLDKDLMQAYFKSAIDVIIHVNKVKNVRQITEVLFTKEF